MLKSVLQKVIFRRRKQTKSLLNNRGYYFVYGIKQGYYMPNKHRSHSLALPMVHNDMISAILHSDQSYDDKGKQHYYIRNYLARMRLLLNSKFAVHKRSFAVDRF